MSGDWPTGLAATKLRPPPPPTGLVRRSRLHDILDASLDQGVPLILASAPAGSGKTTLLASWLNGRPEPVAWLQVEEADADPVRFWSYLLQAIGLVDRTVADEVAPLVPGSGGDDRVVVTALVNALARRAEPLVVAIDDYHLIATPGIHRGIERFVGLCPHRVTVALATRVDPPFRLGRLRVRHQVSEIRAADLRFDPGEAQGLLGPAGRTLDGALVDQLCDRTEGWAAGLVLAGVSLGRAADPGRFVEAFRGDDQIVVGYLSDELLDTLDADDRQRLLETSILEQLDGPLVDAVTGGTDGAAWLRRTAAANQLVIRLDNAATCFRYHHLLRDLLRLEAGQAFPGRLAELHRRAAVAYGTAGDLHPAMLHRLAADDHAEAIRLMRSYGPQLLRGGQIDTLRSLLEQIGPATATSTVCALLHGWCDFIGGRYGPARAWVATALDVAPAGFDPLFVTPLSINISLADGDVGAALAVAQQVTADDELASHPADLATAAGAAYAWAGRAEEARACLALAVEKATDEASRSAHLLALVYGSIVELEAGTTAGAHAAAEAAVEAAHRFGLAAYHGVAPAYAVRARTGTDPAVIRSDTALAVDLVQRVSTPLVRGHVLAVCADLHLDLDLDLDLDDGGGDGEGAALLAEAQVWLGRCQDAGIAGVHLRRIAARHRAAMGPAPESVAGAVDDLTERESAVLRYLPTPLSQREIAAELYVSLNTVKTHCAAIYRKLAVGDRRAAVLAARSRHLL